MKNLRVKVALIRVSFRVRDSIFLLFRVFDVFLFSERCFIENVYLDKCPTSKNNLAKTNVTLPHHRSQRAA